MEIKKQVTSDKYWLDEKGDQIPVNRLTKLEKKQERDTYKLFKEAIAIQAKLTDYKDMVQKICEEIYEMAMKEHGGNIGKGKGGFTIYNFDRSLKIVKNISEPVKFDELTIKAAKDLFDLFLEEAVSSKEDFVKDVIRDAFETRNGQMDAKQVLGLLRYRSKVKNVHFQAALNKIEEAQRRPSSKTYFQLAYLKEDGSYQNVELNFSRI